MVTFDIYFYVICNVVCLYCKPIRLLEGRISIKRDKVELRGYRTLKFVGLETYLVVYNEDLVT